MSFCIVKVDSATGRIVRAIPVIYSNQDKANADASILNSRRERQSSGHHFDVMEFADETVQTPA